MTTIPFAVIGTGWRSEFFMRVALRNPERFRVVGAVSRGNRSFGKKFGVSLFSSVPELLQSERPAFAVCAVPAAFHPAVVRELTALGVPVLCETPPALNLKSMAAMCRMATRQNGRVQIAEQVHLRPHHQAQLAVVQSRKLGNVHEAYVSVSHGHHGISLMRKFLGIGFENAVVTAKRFTAPILQGGGRLGPPKRRKVIPAARDFFWFDFGDRLGIVDFTGPQYFGKIRSEHVQVRGVQGEIVNDRIAYLKDFKTPILCPLTRINDGERGDQTPPRLAGYQAEGKWAYRNPFSAPGMMDDEIAIAHLLLRMDSFVRTGKNFYPLAEGCQDNYLYLLAQQAVAEGRPVKSRTQRWARP